MYQMRSSLLSSGTLYLLEGFNERTWLSLIYYSTLLPLLQIGAISRELLSVFL